MSVPGGNTARRRPAARALRALRRLALAGAIAAAAAAGGGAARAETVVASVSSPRIDIGSNFSGVDIVVFGVVERAWNEPMPPDGYDIAVVVRGPPQPVASRRKERIFGLWINGASEEFPAVPAFYALDSNRPIDDIAGPSALSAYGIGLSHASFGRVPIEEGNAFRDAILRQRTAQGLFREQTGSVTMLTPTFFRATVPLPSKVPNGRYTVETYVFAEKRLVASDLAELTVDKVGFEARVHTMAVGAPLLYGALVVALALLTGWLGGVVFRRD